MGRFRFDRNSFFVGVGTGGALAGVVSRQAGRAAIRTIGGVALREALVFARIAAVAGVRLAVRAPLATLVVADLAARTITGKGDPREGRGIVDIAFIPGPGLVPGRGGPDFITLREGFVRGVEQIVGTGLETLEKLNPVNLFSNLVRR